MPELSALLAVFSLQVIAAAFQLHDEPELPTSAGFLYRSLSEFWAAEAGNGPAL